MERTGVQSSSVESIGYDEESQTLEIEFKNGSIYQYFDVPVHVHVELMNAASVGSYLANMIKGTFRYSRS